MRVIITGGAGFIGRKTALALLERDDEVILVDSLQRRVHPEGEWPAEIRDWPKKAWMMRRDVRYKDAWQTIFDMEPDAILHLAAYQDYMPDYSTFYDTNVVSTALLYETAQERGWRGRVVVASSQAVLGGGLYSCPNVDRCAAGTVPWRDRLPENLAAGRWSLTCTMCGHELKPIWTPERSVKPATPYGFSKLGEEQCALNLGGLLEIPTVALRYSIVQGAGQSPWNAYSGIMRAACLQILADRDVIVFEDGQQVRDFVSIHDVVQANLIALTDDACTGDAYNIGGGVKWTVRELAEFMIEIAGRDLKVVAPGWYRLGDVRDTLSGISKFQAITGWQPTHSKHIATTTWEPYWKWLVGLDLPAEDIVTTAFDNMRASGVLKEARCA